MLEKWKKREKVAKTDLPKESKNTKKEQKPKDATYRMKKNSALKATRIFVWFILIFFLIKGIVVTFKPDTLTEAEKTIKDFREELEEQKKENYEIAAFAQNFTKEYLTYEARNESEYKERLKPYMGKRAEQMGVELNNGSAKATYVQAYKTESYTKNQWDVYVLVEVSYEVISMDDNQKTLVTNTINDQVYVKVPILGQDNTYIVEGLPLFVQDTSLQMNGYQVEEYQGTQLDDVKTAEIKNAVSNFLKAYYEQDESVISYYLDDKADKSDFLGLEGRFEFTSLEKIKCFQEPEQKEIVCTVELKIKDKVNQAKMVQKSSILLRKEGDRYYIESINARTGSIN